MRQAALLVSHGTVDDLDDLAAFVGNIRRGHPPGAGVVAELRRRYEAIGGRSPLNATNAALARKLEDKLDVRVLLANRLWKPYVRDVLAAAAGEGFERLVVVPLAQYSAHVYAGDARAAAEGLPLTLACAPNWGGSSALCAAWAARIAEALSMADVRETSIAMTAHSLPQTVIARGDPYADELRHAAESIAALVRARVGHPVGYALAFQSQGLAVGPRESAVEWLGPTVQGVLEQARSRGDRRVVFAPIGFLADHVEVLYDLDIEARRAAEALDLHYTRARSLNADDDFVDVLAEIAAPLLQG